MEDDVQRLISEYCAIEKMNRIFRSAAQTDEIELLGSRVRELRRLEILLKLANWIIVACPAETQSRAITTATLDRKIADLIEARRVQCENSP